MVARRTAKGILVEWAHHLLGLELSNWGRWGAADELGTLNLVTPAKRVEAAALVRKGSIFDLGIAFDGKGPQSGIGLRKNPVHLMTMLPVDSIDAPDGLIVMDDMVIMGLQVGTQWDSLAHVGYDDVLYNGVAATVVDHRAGARRNSFDKVVTRLISRGVLLDIARLHGVDRLDPSYEITGDDLTAAAERQAVGVGAGDILLVRTGAMQWFLGGDAPRFMADQTGLGLSCARWLRERDVAAVAVDNAFCEVVPSRIPGARIPFHQVAIRDIGLMLGEMFNLEELAGDCAQHGIWDFQSCGPGPRVTGPVGSPVTPMALK